MGLDNLPVFEIQPFYIGRDVLVHELARITYNHSPQSVPPYRKQVVRFVMGRTPDSAFIYVTSDCMLRDNDELFAIEEIVPHSIRVRDIAKYEILYKEEMQLHKSQYLRI